jgi:hypothetical protein
MPLLPLLIVRRGEVERGVGLGVAIAETAAAVDAGRPPADPRSSLPLQMTATAKATMMTGGMRLTAAMFLVLLLPFLV